ncbi:short chain dehydrogenase like protein [Zymoseptoria brevis]|uniref:Short chain dehydrogenase like protein n=1 Tax=Zymoseptoria brevis TaxID=1047168 RepID=A0A0F4GDP2_9PEZI|nr:short chain dehydrogenase like protein [Zymoseptoria brevis]
MADTNTSFESVINLSEHLDLSEPFSDNWLNGRHVLITGGAGALGSNFVRRWAKAGATLVIGDRDAEKGSQLVAELRQEFQRDNVAWFVECDIVQWESQVNLFQEAARLSLHGGIDAVIANAGAGGPDVLGVPNRELPSPHAPPDISTTMINYVGLLYTVHLASYYLAHNPGSTPCSPKPPVGTPRTSRDRHLLLVGSVASLTPVVGRPQYTGSKHAVLGIFRALRATSFLSGIRVTLLCPYFVDSAMVAPHIKPLLEGTELAEMHDVVEAATRLVADERISGRGLVVGPPLQRSESQGLLVPDFDPRSTDDVRIWDCYADDYQKVQIFTRRLVNALGQQELANKIE